MRFSTGRHMSRLDDPDDTVVLDDVVRFRGQRVAAVVAETKQIADQAVLALKVSYELLPAVFDPELADTPGAPLVHGDKTAADARLADPSRNLVAELHGGVGDVDAAVWAAEVSGGAVVRGRWRSQRVQHVAPGDTRGHRLARRRGPDCPSHEFAGAIPGPRRGGPCVRSGPRRTSGCSPRA